MEIRTEQVQALLNQQENIAKRRASGTGAGFDAVLADRLALDSTPETVRQDGLANAGANSSVVGQMLLASAENASTASSAQSAMQQLFAQTSNTLDMWDAYVAKLGDAKSSSLRDAYALLEGVDAQVATLKQQAGPALSQNPQLAGLLNELEILTTTEKFKLNRGDYS